MSGIPVDVGFGVTRIRSWFRDEIGNERGVHGTGFWVRDRERDIYVTNRHNVDPVLKYGADTKLKLDHVELELRRMGPGVAHSETRFFRVANLSSALRASVIADCAIIVAPDLDDRPSDFRVSAAADFQAIADQDWLNDRVHGMDTASFIGFPGMNASQAWWDEEWNYPIARSCVIASPPGRSFANKQIKTADVTLVSGFSFRGSSGSPVVAHQKGFKVGQGLDGGPEFVPAKVVGIMSGHFETDGSEPEMFRHTGLSYFTRSTSILELLGTTHEPTIGVAVPPIDQRSAAAQIIAQGPSTISESGQGTTAMMAVRPKLVFRKRSASRHPKTNLVTTALTFEAGTPGLVSEPEITVEFSRPFRDVLFSVEGMGGAQRNDKFPPEVSADKRRYRCGLAYLPPNQRIVLQFTSEDELGEPSIATI
ncbi:MAG TPA: hypothetical protein VMJ10_14935 [Kofleriaceae bacterium]|nr:hypothetical protein [Kofleriaceae bacterium]